MQRGSHNTTESLKEKKKRNRLIIQRHDIACEKRPRTAPNCERNKYQYARNGKVC